jgi:hypothetical protein
VEAGTAAQQAADLGNRHGGIMRIRRALITPAILALGVVGSLLTGSAIPVAAGHVATAQTQAAAATAIPKMLYHG